MEIVASVPFAVAVNRFASAIPRSEGSGDVSMPASPRIVEALFAANGIRRRRQEMTIVANRKTKLALNAYGVSGVNA
jgi:hypothetical protein